MDDVLPAKFPAPAYTAEIECDPAGNEDVARVAAPAERFAVPIGLLPSWNVTEPVGVPVPGATGPTVTVNVMDWPNLDGLTDVVTAVVVEIRWTVWPTAVESLAAKLPPPP